VDYRILIVFGTTISDTVGHQMIIQVFTSPNICFCTTWQSQNVQWRWNEQKGQKPCVTLFIVTWRRIMRFW